MTIDIVFIYNNGTPDMLFKYIGTTEAAIITRKQKTFVNMLKRFDNMLIWNSPIDL